MSARILIVDDEQSMREFLEIFFRRQGYEVATAASVDEALAEINGRDFDLVISDIQMPGRTGIELLKILRRDFPDILVIMITAFGTTETAIEAMKDGAYDYITKPFKVDEIRLVVEKALEKKMLYTENRRLRKELQTQKRSRALIGNSASMLHVLDLIQQVASTKTNVLITGASGTGKELVARAVHDQSDRREGPFVAINCAAIPENLLESELFGHVKGAFTGAVQNKAGLFEEAHQGSVFLDEVGELPQLLQVKLLRVIQERVIRRVGATADREVDVRILAATNRNLEDEVRAGRFREDLYYRLNVIQIALPSLYERIDDVPLLVQHFLEKYAKGLGKNVQEISKEAMAKLLAYHYPGNVRELENIIERAVALSRGTRIEVEALPPTVLYPTRNNVNISRIPRSGANLEQMVADYERGILLEALAQTKGVKKKAAQLLGVSFRSFRYRLEKLGLDDGSSELE